MKFSKSAFHRTIWVFGLLSSLTPTALLAVDEASLPVIPDTPGASFDPAQVDTVSNKTRAFGGGASTKRLPPAPRTKAEIIRLMKKPSKTRGIGGKALSPKARAYINFSSKPKTLYKNLPNNCEELNLGFCFTQDLVHNTKEKIF